MKTSSILHPQLFRLCLSLVCIACTSTPNREEAVQKLARDITVAENKLPQKTVAIFTPETRELAGESEAVELADLLTHEIVTSSNLKVVERARLGALLKERELIQSGLADPATAAKYGRLLAVDAVLIGSITGKDDESEIFLRLIDSQSAVILKTARGKIPRKVAAPVATEKSPAIIAKPIVTAAKKQSLPPSLPATTGSLEPTDEAQGRLVDISFRKGVAGGYSQVIGRLENTGKVPLGDIRISAQLYDRGKNLIAGAPCMVPDSPLNTGARQPFSCLFKPPTDYASYALSYEPAPVTYSSHARNLRGSGVKFRSDTGGGLAHYALSGMIANNEEITVTYPKITASFFDASGKFIGSAYGFAVKRNLKPGESSPFNMNIYSYALHGKPVRYELFYSALATRN